MSVAFAYSGVSSMVCKVCVSRSGYEADLNGDGSMQIQTQSKRQGIKELHGVILPRDGRRDMSLLPEGNWKSGATGSCGT